ncbi:MAG: hypothetical protein QF689_16410, partial [Candidatus Latescibacteria bacterium]|nr:hypothetical protein [Candidatus Latescibacterota bacterium]
WVRLGRLYDRVGEPERSELAYAQALALDPADAAALGGVAHLRVGLGDDEAALPLLELLTVLSPEDRQVWLELARIYRERGLHEHSARAQQRASGPASGQVDPEEAAPAAVVIDDEDGSVTTDGD